MTPVKFPECNCQFRPPPDLDESQCMTIDAFNGQVQGGSLDGVRVIVVAWKPTEAEIEQIKSGDPIYISFVGGLPPHFPAMTFNQATHPS